MIRNIDINAKFNRAIFLVIRENRILFGLAVRRNEPVKDRWCFYVGITEEEYSILVENASDDQELSFIGLPNTCINVPESLAELYFTPSPGRFAGCHFDADPFSGSWAGDSILKALAQHIEKTMRKIQHVNQAKTPAVSV